MNGLDALLDELADRIAARLESRQREAAPGMIDQAASPLGRRKHCAAVRSRLARGELGAAIVGRRHFLGRDALADEMARASGSKVRKEPAEAGDVRAELDRELRLLRGGAR